VRNLALVVIFLVGCSSFFKKTEPNFSFQKIEQMKVGKTTLPEITENLGKPAKITYDSGKEIWTYRDRNTDYQRLTITFDSSFVLQSIVWLPLPHEDEIYLEKIKAHFPQANFKQIPGPDNPHSISSMVSYVEETLGMIVVYQKERNAVEAVVWTDSTRSPATFVELSGPYTIDNM